MSTPEDIKALEAIAEAEAAGQDPFGDDEAEPETEGAVAEAEGGDTGEADAQPAAMPAYKAELPGDYKAQRAELMKAKAEAMKQLMEGDIDAEAFALEDARVAEALEDLAAVRIRAETLQEANSQALQAYQSRTIQRLISKTKAEVDYATDTAAQQQFDTSMQVLSAQPANAGKDFADLADDAHKMVRAMRGIATQARPAAADRKPEGDVPVTLRSLPSAATSNTGGVIEQIARLKGPAYEVAFAKLTPAQQAALLDAD